MTIIVSSTKPVYWECKENGHRKFWAAQIVTRKPKSKSVMDEKIVLVRKWGAIGNQAQTMEQEFGNYIEAETILGRLIKEKENKGYKPIF